MKRNNGGVSKAEGGGVEKLRSDDGCQSKLVA